MLRYNFHQASEKAWESSGRRQVSERRTEREVVEISDFEGALKELEIWNLGEELQNYSTAALESLSSTAQREDLSRPRRSIVLRSLTLVSNRVAAQLSPSRPSRYRDLRPDIVGASKPSRLIDIPEPLLEFQTLPVSRASRRCSRASFVRRFAKAASVSGVRGNQETLVL